MPAKLGCEGATLVQVAPSGLAMKVNEWLEMVDSYCHSDRLEHRLGLSGMDTLSATLGPYPKVPVSIVGGVLNCDPHNFSRISSPRDPRWGVAVSIQLKHASRVNDRVLNQLQTILQDRRVAAVSEVGLDFSTHLPSWDGQFQLLQCILGMDVSKKVLVLHLRGSKFYPVATDASQCTLKEVEGMCSCEQLIHVHCCTLDTSEVEKWCGVSSIRTLVSQELPGFLEQTSVGH